VTKKKSKPKNQKLADNNEEEINLTQADQTGENEFVNN
jgi:hypothetical protein